MTPILFDLNNKSFTNLNPMSEGRDLRNKVQIHKNFFEINLTPIVKLREFEQIALIDIKKEFEMNLVYLGY